MSYDNSGLRRLQQKLRDISRTRQVSLTDLFSLSFMREYTRFVSFEAMLKASPFEVETAKDFEAIQGAEWEKFIRKETNFRSWEALQQEAGLEWANARITQGLREAKNDKRRNASLTSMAGPEKGPRGVIQVLLQAGRYKLSNALAWPRSSRKGSSCSSCSA